MKFDIKVGNQFLTPVELYIRGGTVNEGYLGDPNLPIVLGYRPGFNQRDIEKVNRIRQHLKEVDGLAISVSFGIDDPIRNRGRIGLAELDPLTGKARSLPRLSGIERSDGKVDRRGLNRYSLTEEARKHLMEAFPSLNDEPREGQPPKK